MHWHRFLKSPLFSASDDDLQILASHKTQTHWFERLEFLSDELESHHPLKRAWHFISAWRSLADKIPVHDLLDKIFAQADVLERYKRSTPEALQARVQANLTLFLEMALDLDSGRYPSLMHFLFHLRSLRYTQSDAPDEAPMETREPRVRIMTIHASKGLEAPVVYLADTITGAKDRSSLNTLVDWPVENKQPEHFQLVPSSKLQDSITRELTKQSKDASQKEDANLLYVAITRARQYLFISGCQPDRGPFTNWYQPIFTALQTLTGNMEDELLTYPFGQQLSCNDTKISSIKADTKIDINSALTTKIISHEKPQVMLAPSRIERNSVHFNSDEYDIAQNYANHNAESNYSAKIRGIAIHRMLELLCENQDLSDKSILQKIIFELRIEDQEQLQDWLTIATSNYSHPDLQSIFKPDNFIKVYDECPIQYSKDNRLVYGIIDRLIVTQNHVIIVDYKTHQHANKNNLQELSKPYQQQMSFYAEGLKPLWPDRQIKSYLLFTECFELFELEV